MSPDDVESVVVVDEDSWDLDAASLEEDFAAAPAAVDGAAASEVAAVVGGLLAGATSTTASVGCTTSGGGWVLPAGWVFVLVPVGAEGCGVDEGIWLAALDVTGTAAPAVIVERDGVELEVVELEVVDWAVVEEGEVDATLDDAAAGEDDRLSGPGSGPDASLKLRAATAAAPPAKRRNPA